jgi:hypothetical protein
MPVGSTGRAARKDPCRIGHKGALMLKTPT